MSKKNKKTQEPTHEVTGKFVVQEHPAKGIWMISAEVVSANDTNDKHYIPQGINTAEGLHLHLFDHESEADRVAKRFEKLFKWNEEQERK